MTNTELSWLAGLVEGEGCFYLRRPPQGRNQLGFRLAMTDEDVVQKVSSLIGGRVLPYSAENRTPWFVVCRYGFDAEEMFVGLRPLMGSRRGGNIDELLAEPELSHGETSLTMKNDVQRNDTAWLAGLLEGEAWFGAEARKNGRFVLRVGLKMCDRDVVEDAANLMGAPSVTPQKTQKAFHAIPWQAKANGRKAEATMRAVLPYMGERRTMQIQAALGKCDDLSPN